MMKIRDLKNKEIIEIYSNSNEFDRGNKILLFLEGGIGILINSFWGSYFDLKDNYRLQIPSFSKIDLIDNIIKLENILTIEGVSTTVQLSNGHLIHLFEEIEDLERFAYYNKIEVLSPSKNPERYHDILNDVKEAKEMIFNKTEWIEKELGSK